VIICVHVIISLSESEVFGVKVAISCALYDQLELFCMRHQRVNLVFTEVDGNRLNVSGKIANLYVREGREYLITDSGQEYWLDNLITVEAID
jgi:transcriptional antiterminator Rof (Rho-off)